jgi:hypothetical protein
MFVGCAVSVALSAGIRARVQDVRVGYVGVALIVVGFVLPWVTVRVSGSSRAYWAFEVPVVGWLALVFVLALGGLVVVAGKYSSAVASGVGALLAAVSFLGTTITGFLLYFVPRLLPTGLLPRAARQYVPSVSAGFGMPFLAVGFGVLAAWCGVRLVSTAAVRVTRRNARRGPGLPTLPPPELAPSPSRPLPPLPDPR